jgi:hypothetical protein
MEVLPHVVAPVILGVITLVVWMTVAIPDRLWARVQLLPVRVRDRHSR